MVVSRAEQPFVWPPAPTPVGAVPPPAGVAPPAAVRAPGERLVEALRAAERVWLVPTAVPLRRRMLEEGWSPDPFEA